MNGERRRQDRNDKTYWWFVARRRLLGDMLDHYLCDPEYRNAKILDLCGGSGGYFSVLKNYGSAVGAGDSEGLLRRRAKRHGGTFVCSRANRLPFADETFDAAVAVNALERSAHDVAALEEVFRVLRPGGRLITVVSAYGFLWGEHDEVLRHQRRYSAHELRRRLTRAGFDIERVTYFANFLLAPVLLWRLVQNVFRKSARQRRARVLLPAWLNSLVIAVLDFERFLLRFGNFPAGIALVCVAEKPRTQSVRILDPATQMMRARAGLVQPSSAFAPHT